MFEKIKHILSLIFGKNTLDYICGTEALPMPFSQEEESDKISLLESGDEHAKSELVEHNLRLVVYIAKKFEGSGVDGDDLVSVGTIGLIKAINSFKLLQASLSKLPPREQRIMRMRFALDGGDEMTQKDVADKLGISQSYISRLEKKIISKLKKDISKQI